MTPRPINFVLERLLEQRRTYLGAMSLIRMYLQPIPVHDRHQ